MQLQISLLIVLSFVSANSCHGGDLPPPDNAVADGGVVGSSASDTGPPDTAVAISIPCDCCGTTIDVPESEGCSHGACDPWCGVVDPCTDCDAAGNVCVRRWSREDAGAPATPLFECVPRPEVCGELQNCGVPQDPTTCIQHDACFTALSCEPSRVLLQGYLIECVGA